MNSRSEPNIIPEETETTYFMNRDGLMETTITCGGAGGLSTDPSMDGNRSAPSPPPPQNNVINPGLKNLVRDVQVNSINFNSILVDFHNLQSFMQQLSYLHNKINGLD